MFYFFVPFVVLAVWGGVGKKLGFGTSGQDAPPTRLIKMPLPQGSFGFGTSGQDAPPTRLIKKPSFQEKTRLLGLRLRAIEEHGFPHLQFFGAVRTGGVSQQAVPQENAARVTPTIDMAVAVEVDYPLLVSLVAGEAFGSDHQVVKSRPQCA